MADEDPEQLVVVRPDRAVDHDPRQGAERDLDRLRPGREHHGDPERAAVRLQERQQADERAPVRDMRGHDRQI